MKNPRYLSIDVPGGKVGGLCFTGPNDPLYFAEVLFEEESAEADDYRALAKILDHYRPSLLIIEHGFLFKILPYLGGLKMAAAERHIPWYQITASKAKKTVLGRGRASKAEVLEWARSVEPTVPSQHCADSLLYLHAWRQIHGT